MSSLKHKGYVGSVEYSEEDDCLFGKVLGMSKTLINYEGNTVQELKADFIKGVEQYLDYCKEQGLTPEKSFIDTFNVRIPSEIYGKIVSMAKDESVTLAFVRSAVEEKLANMGIMPKQKGAWKQR